MTYITTSPPRTGLDQFGSLDDETFAALIAACEMDVAVTDEEQPVVTAQPLSSEWAPTVAAPWRGGTLDTVKQMADLCGGVVSDELLAPEDRTRVFARRLARAGQVRGASYADGRFVAPDIG